MTAKRFTIKEFSTLDAMSSLDVICDNGIELPSSTACDLLNELHEENQYLKSLKWNQDCINEISIGIQQRQSLEEENEQLKKEREELFIRERDTKNEWRELKQENEELKQFKEDVFNKIDMHLRMLPTARDNEFNDDDGDPSLYVGAIYMLETLKKELEE